MKIEIAEPGRMTESGSSLLRLIQNNNTPLLDLLVRESIQNSLDAKNDENDYVDVNFITGQFSSHQLNAELERATRVLDERYASTEPNFLAIRDTNTVGLTGKLHYDDVLDNQYGNLLKLVYEISRPQEADGAGGSWGLGKTVYFRIGIGLVIYYSRILNEQGNYESRLAASLVEDETKDDTIIPGYQGKARRGIAWWGEQIGENKTRPVTDETYIRRILNIFGVPPYQGNETGTMIIIPYLDVEKLLSNNQVEHVRVDNSPVRAYWTKHLEDYLSIAIQRWYAPRIDNPSYPYGKYLIPEINGIPIRYRNMEPTFQIVHSLYNLANERTTPDDILNHSEWAKSKVEKLTTRGTVKDNNRGYGRIAFTRVKRELLKMTPPDNKYNPYIYLNCEQREQDRNRPIICFTRKPGMIVNYETVGNWVDNIDPCNAGEYIFGIFVLCSDNFLSEKYGGISLEEYVRKSERADHTSWLDLAINNTNPRIITNIQRQLTRKISQYFAGYEEPVEARTNTGLSKLLGNILLPPENFGHKPSIPKKPGSGTSGPSRKRQLIYRYVESETEYVHNGMILHLECLSSRRMSMFGFDLCIDSERGAISVKEWEKYGLYVPFAISEVAIKQLKIDDLKINCPIVLTQRISNINNEYYHGYLSVSNQGVPCMFRLDLNAPAKVECRFTITIELNSRDVRPVLNLLKDGEA